MTRALSSPPPWHAKSSAAVPPCAKPNKKRRRRGQPCCPSNRTRLRSRVRVALARRPVRRRSPVLGLMRSPSISNASCQANPSSPAGSGSGARSASAEVCGSASRSASFANGRGVSPSPCSSTNKFGSVRLPAAHTLPPKPMALSSASDGAVRCAAAAHAQKTLHPSRWTRCSRGHEEASADAFGGGGGGGDRHGRDG